MELKLFFKKELNRILSISFYHWKVYTSQIELKNDKTTSTHTQDQVNTHPVFTGPTWIMSEKCSKLAIKTVKQLSWVLLKIIDIK